MARVTSLTDSSSLVEVVDRILDKGLVIDVWATVSVLGIELFTLEARIVVASCETYLRYAEAIGMTAPVARPPATPPPAVPPPPEPPPAAPAQ